MTRKAERPLQAKKRPYRRPKLVVHGDLKTLTQAKGGSMGDGGKPATRSAGMAG